MRWSNSSAVAPVDDEGVHALARDSRGQHPPAGGAGHVGVLALRVDDVGPHAPADAPQHSQLGGEGLARTGPGQDGGVGVQVGAVEGVVDDGGAGPAGRCRRGCRCGCPGPAERRGTAGPGWTCPASATPPQRSGPGAGWTAVPRAAGRPGRPACPGWRRSGRGPSGSGP